ncbi:MAG: hypothetical protein FWG60_01190, partial [Methanomassiliicoccaceae archaeon]|nr:hypothetical protein [Methanomassiliicoccaceae archaeon]
MRSMNAGGPHRRSSDDEESIINRRSAAVIACIAVAVIVGAACAFMFLNNGEDDSYKVTYFKKGKMVSEETVPAGTYVTIIDGIGADDDQERFIGWNTRSDMSGSTLLPGTLYRVDRSISLHAMAAGSEMFAIILPEKKEGFNITADPMMVVRGGSSIISYSLEPSHVDDDLVIFVNGNPMKLDAMKRIHLTDINEDKIVTVTGIYDRREHSISLPDDQRGYVLTSSAEKVHHGESYTLEFKLLPGYAETQEFGIHVNGGDAKRPSEGTVLIEDVRDNHVITVTGVEPIRYDISAGRNVLVFVNGAAASKATVEDTVTIQPADGYSVPETFNAQIKGKFTVKGNGYKVTDNIVFPSILKIT